MTKFDPIAYKEMVKSYQDQDNPTGWFDSIYTDAQGDHRAVFWADLEPSPYLLEWLKSCVFNHTGRKAIVIGCGVGDDAEALSESGYEVTAFISHPKQYVFAKTVIQTPRSTTLWQIFLITHHNGLKVLSLFMSVTQFKFYQVNTEYKLEMPWYHYWYRGGIFLSHVEVVSRENRKITFPFLLIKRR